jgi:galactokinase
MTDSPLAHTSHLSDIYANPVPQYTRYRNLLTKFAELPGSQSPDFVVRSPGRVNIIGDHIDYSLFSVLPMAIESDMVMAVSKAADHKVSVHNVLGSFKPEDFTVKTGDNEAPLTIDATKSDWVNYMRCGILVADDYLKTHQKHHHSLNGMKVVIDGNVPAGGGLSSSAAFVVCSTLATLLANDYTDISKSLLTKLSITCEQHVGVNSGGMDQSASIFGLKNHALFVSFQPQLDVKEFAFPKTNPQIAFVISNSLVTANKHETAPIHYNLRVVEVTLASNIMAKKLGLKIPQDGNLQAGTLRGVLDSYFKDSTPYGVDHEDSRKKLAKMDQLVEEIFTEKDGYTLQQVAETLGISVDELKQKYMTTYPVRFEKLQLYKRAKHVFLESKRVLDFISLLDTVTDTEELFKGLGQLMNQSHQSSVELFNNSCPELNDICRIALENGSYGSRVTGAGWGGSAVHLVPATDAKKLILALTSEYYKNKFPNITEDELNEALVLSEPGSGTTVVDNVSLD